MRQGFVIALLTMTAFFISNNRANTAGAIAEGIAPEGVAEGYVISMQINLPNLEEARTSALAECKKGAELMTSGSRPNDGHAKARARCKVVTTFVNKCSANALDPKDGTPGAGWAIGETQQQADDEAVARCQNTAGEKRRSFCKVVDRYCDGTAK